MVINLYGKDAINIYIVGRWDSMFRNGDKVLTESL